MSQAPGKVVNGIKPINGAESADTGPVPNGTKPVDETFIRAAIDKANLNALRMALLQVTGDKDLAKMRTRRHGIRGGAMFSHVLAEEDAPALKEKAFAYLSKRQLDDSVPPPPSKEESRLAMPRLGRVKEVSFSKNETQDVGRHGMHLCG
ncbi:hypothetical protein NM208_g10154 [Fusarium decemcellulare]|uniref:Uncharacterized protein n=1 Tax=Fusarium decemcellulare TaxID=57161 RepID=A0ACC1RZ06_9HYPO|nr:hypothetical protein NM208_g10154 [Fusarium decemcellulare]